MRNVNTALQQGAMTWVTSSRGSQVVAYDRYDINGEFLVEIAFSGTQADGSLVNLPGGSTSWTEVTPSGAPGGVSHTAPPYFKLVPHDFAVFQGHAR